MRESPVGTVQQPDRPLGPHQRLVDRHPSATSRVAPARSPRRGYTPPRPATQALRAGPGPERGRRPYRTSPHVRRTGGNRGQGAARSGGSRGRDWSGCARWVVLEADHQPAGFGLAAFRVHPIRTMWPLDCAVLMTPGTTPDPPGRRAVGPMTAGCSRGGREGRSVCRGSRRPRWGGPSDRGRALGDGSPDRCGRWEL